MSLHPLMKKQRVSQYTTLDSWDPLSPSSRIPLDVRRVFYERQSVRNVDRLSNLPPEILTIIIRFLDSESQFAFADVCKKFRELTLPEKSCFSPNAYPEHKRWTRAASLISRLTYLQLLDLNTYHVNEFLKNNTQVAKFGENLARNCPLIFEMHLLGQKGARLVNAYVMSDTFKSRPCRLTRFAINIQAAAIGCAIQLTPIADKIRLQSLKFYTDKVIARSNRTMFLLQELFHKLLPGIPIFTILMRDHDTDVIATAIEEASGMIKFTTEEVFGTSLITLAERNPNLQKLHFTPDTDAFMSLHLLPKLNHLVIQNSKYLEITIEDLVDAFSAEPLKSGLRILEIKGRICEDCLLAICKLVNLELLILDKHNYPVEYEDYQPYSIMTKLETVIFRVPVSYKRDIDANGAIPEAKDFERQLVANLFPALKRIQYLDGWFCVKENYLFKPEPFKDPELFNW